MLDCCIGCLIYCKESILAAIMGISHNIQLNEQLYCEWIVKRDHVEVNCVSYGSNKKDIPLLSHMFSFVITQCLLNLLVCVDYSL